MRSRRCGSPSARRSTVAFAADALRRFARYLPRVVTDGSDREARGECLVAAWLAGSVLGAGTALHHKLAHVLGGLGLPHAQTHAIILPHVTRFNLAAAPEARSRLAEAFATDDPAQGLAAMLRLFPIPQRLREVGFDREKTDFVAGEIAAMSVSVPRKAGVEDVRAVLEAAYLDKGIIMSVSAIEHLTAAHGALTAAGAGQGRDLVILHSLLTDRHAFDPVLPALAAKFRVTLFNLPGFHGSAPVMALMDAYVARIEDGFEEFEIGDDAILLGNGFGGTLALAFALAHPTRLGKLVLCDAAPGFPRAGQAGVPDDGRTVAKDGLGAIADVAANRVFHAAYLAAHPNAIEERRAVLLKIDPNAFRAACTILTEADYTTRLHGDESADAGRVRRARPGDPAGAQQADRREGAGRALCGACRLRPLPAAGAAGRVPGRDQGFRRVVTPPPYGR